MEFRQPTTPHESLELSSRPRQPLSCRTEWTTKGCCVGTFMFVSAAVVVDRKINVISCEASLLLLLRSGWLEASGKHHIRVTGQCHRFCQDAPTQHDINGPFASSMTLIPSTAYHRAVAMSSSFATTMNIARRFPFIAMSALILVDFLLISDFIPASAAARASTKHDQAIEIVEGDILVDKKIKQLLVSPESGRSRRDVAKLNEHRWRRGIVPFIFSEDMSTALRVAITKGMDEFHEKTCIWFTHRKNEEDYVEFMPGDGCYSSVGRQGGKQVVSVGPGCTTRYTMLHELMHTIGFFHEQSRYDRDLYVRVLWWNLAEGAEKNFHTYPHGKVDTLGMPYDFNSLMHYKNKDFSKNYQDTIQAIDNPTKPLGNNRGFSPLDLKQIVRLYRCQKKKYQMRADKCKDKAASVCLLFKAYSKYCYKFKSYTMAYCQRTCQYCKFKV